MRSKHAEVDESRPLLSSDNSRTSLTGRPGYEDLEKENTGIQYFLKAKSFTGADSDIPPPILPVEGHKQSSLVTIFVIWNTMVGTSLLTMPWGLERAGLGMGMFLVIIMAALCCYTGYCNVATQSAYGPAGGEISELTRHMLGRQAELLSKLFSYIVLSGALIVYWILMSNFLYFIVEYLYTIATGGFDNMTMNKTEVCMIRDEIRNATANTESDLFRQLWNLDTSVPIYLLVLVAPLLSFKSVTFFTKFNSLGILSLLYLMVFVLYKGWKWGVHIDLTSPSSPEYTTTFKYTFFATSGMLAMSYFMQNIIISIMRSNRNQKNNARDLCIGYFLAMMTYLIIGTVFYVTFPLSKTCIQDNLLNNFPSWDVLTLVARVFLFFQLVTVFPLISFLLRFQVMTAFFSSQYPSRMHILVFNAVIVTTCVLFAVFLPRIGLIIRFTGALSGFYHVFTLPCLLRLAGQRKSGKLSIPSLILHLGIPLAGLINLLAQFFVTDS